ncbi:LysR family transcriptional regulator [Pseudomonas aeruginosa]|uniref:LysR family transcriptional regulator n=1 Tax=Pseudomonas aeruginosa TaxID=287 RepID=UPI0010122227|nr:LysR substrate-binding domain-containing protein [Pseudomonas aeruginosa]
MQLSQLRAFCAVAHTGSINAAAKALNRGPSSLSVRIRQLEEDLGCQLFLREHQRLRLSPDGRRLLEHARRILDLSDSTRAMMRNEESGGRLVVGALDVVLVAFMPCLIGRFRQRHRAIELDIRSEASEALVQQVSDGVLDLALSDGPVRSQTLESSLAFVDEMVLVTELDHPPITSPRDLRCAELYGFRHDCSFRFRMDRWLEEADCLQQLPVLEIESYHTMLACVSAGMGAAWVLRSVLATLPGNHQVRAHPLRDYGTTEIHFIWHSGHLTPNAQRLMAVHQDALVERRD